MDLTTQIRGAAFVFLGQREHSRRELLSKLADKFNLPVDAPLNYSSAWRAWRQTATRATSVLLRCSCAAEEREATAPSVH
jgi:hypothetical protein